MWNGYFYLLANFKMSEEKPNQPQLPPTKAIDRLSNHAFENWFEYPVRVQPHHTDYAGVAWHGTYIAWMEEARMECFRAIGIDYSDLVNLGCDLPVIELSVRYHSSIQLGMAAVVRTRMSEVTGVRINWDYAIESPDRQELYATAKVILVAVDRDKGKIVRQLPPAVKDVLDRLSASVK
jgi:acyl-CoA thioester hydrolase